MSSVRSAAAAHELLELRLSERQEISERFFTGEAQNIARLCHRMAERFARGGRLIAIGLSPAQRSDVRHVAVRVRPPGDRGQARAAGARPDRGVGGAWPRSWP